MLDRQRERWPAYEEAYVQKMRGLYRSDRAVWDELLARPSVTLLCYCKEAMFCHRTILANILGKLGATVMPPHLCHAMACSVQVAPEMLMCAKHWNMVPASIRSRVWKAYRPGQCDDKNPSVAWHDAADAAILSVWERERSEVLLEESQGELFR